MSINYSSSPITYGLVYYSDFANTKCYQPDTSLRGMGGTLNSTYINNTGGKLAYNTSSGEMTRSVVNSGTDLYRSDSTILLPSNFTMHALVKVTGTHTNTANGIITNHSHTGFTGAGITIKEVSATDLRISCNTGSGTARTYFSYFGSTNIYNTWVFLTLRFIGNSFTLWVNDAIDYTGSYAQVNAADYIDLFNWSTSNYTSASYRPACSISMASVYDRDLSDSEIKANFSAYRGRYNL